MTNEIAAYDYIVVGGGSAGAVVASRLSEDPGVSVLLLEAGGRTHRHPLIRMPIGFLKAYRRKAFSTKFEAEPEPQLNGRRIISWRGRGLGGSSTVNGMMYNRGLPSDYDAWRDLGLPGWGYDDLLPYFRRLETSWRGAGRHHGANGPIAVPQVHDPQLLYEDFEASAIEAGLARSDDLFGEENEGVSRLELSVGRGERSSTASGYLDPARGRPNLTISTHSPALRLVIENGRAVAVEYAQDTRRLTARCRREVIVSAGIYQSPHLLLLSGIGPADELRAVGVAPLLDLPGVGRNLQEHPMFPMVWNANRSDTFLNNLRLDRAARLATRWLLSRSGAFTSTACHGIAFARSSPQRNRPDLYLAATAVGLEADLWLPGFTRPPMHRFVNIVAICQPESRGWVKLRSADPTEKPRTFYNMLDAPADLAGLVAGFKLARAIYGCGPQAASISAEAVPGASVTTEAQIEDFIRSCVGPGEHSSGTCAMGPDHDRNAVVDSQLRVRGVDGLRIADASIMPLITSGNINIPVIMIGEKAADLIRGRKSLAETDSHSWRQDAA